METMAKYAVFKTAAIAQTARYGFLNIQRSVRNSTPDFTNHQK
jgi:hypothetical protein